MKRREIKIQVHFIEIQEKDVEQKEKINRLYKRILIEKIKNSNISIKDIEYRI